MGEHGVKIYEGVEGRIRDAIERGDFDNLPNKGKPLDLSGWLKTPAHLRMSYSILKSAGYKPSEIHTKSEMAALREMIENESDEEKKSRLLKKLSALAITDSIRMEKLSPDRGRRRGNSKKF
jgi:DnaJ homologue, subfamily C, member 28, conserved domain